MMGAGCQSEIVMCWWRMDVGVWGFGPGWAGLVVRARGHIAGLDLVRQI
jgi:hypothetical protein